MVISIMLALNQTLLKLWDMSYSEHMCYLPCSAFKQFYCLKLFLIVL